jgi:hypothetical protein
MRVVVVGASGSPIEWAGVGAMRSPRHSFILCLAKAPGLATRFEFDFIFNVTSIPEFPRAVECN